jgi:flagellar motility protein MotE (MotC chaperone)
MKFLKRLHINIFTLLVIIAGLGILFRAINIVTFNDGTAGSVAVAQAQDPVVEESHEKPPEITQEDVKKSVEAAAAEDKPEKPAAPAAAPATGDKKSPPKLNTNAEDRSFTASEVEVLQSLSKRRDELDKREKGIAAREALLKAAEQEVDRKVGELNTMKADIEKLLGQQAKMEEDRIISLVKIYEGMKPKEAATIFNTLDMDVLLSVISRMSERKSSPVLAAMDPEKARIVTIRLAEQRKLPGKVETKAPPQPPALPPAAEPPAQ